MFGFGAAELIIIAALLLLFFGGKKIPEFVRGITDSIKEFRNGMKD